MALDASQPLGASLLLLGGDIASASLAVQSHVQSQKRDQMDKEMPMICSKRQAAAKTPMVPRGSLPARCPGAPYLALRIRAGNASPPCGPPESGRWLPPAAFCYKPRLTAKRPLGSGSIDGALPDGQSVRARTGLGSGTRSPPAPAGLETAQIRRFCPVLRGGLCAVGRVRSPGGTIRPRAG
ncbi:hypothetical protein C8Q77DRAFT_616591 [Trametes polyzona]|nr:hypothetical protein C8Q77DRAFT_616591 [Trametes polyzona]